jgi:hypothetical protein
MADSFNFELVSPERLLLSATATEVVIPGTDGEMTVMAHHSPTMTTIKPGVVTVVTAEGQTERYVVFGGFADILPEGLHAAGRVRCCRGRYRPRRSRAGGFRTRARTWRMPPIGRGPAESAGVSRSSDHAGSGDLIEQRMRFNQIRLSGRSAGRPSYDRRMVVARSSAGGSARQVTGSVAWRRSRKACG